MASGVIGSLRVNLGLDSAQFIKGMANSRSAMLRFAAKAGTLAGTAAGSMKTAMVAMGVAAIDSATEIENLSRVANTTPQTFQEWAAGAKSVGIEQDKLGDILKDTNDKVGDFISTGGGELQDFFQNIAPKVGVTADQFRRLSGPEALQLYVDSLQKAGLNQQQMTFYMEAIADEATALLPLLKDGGKGMSEYAVKARAVGAVMDSDMLASLDRGKVALADMKLALTGMKNTIGAQAVPAVEALSSAVTTAATFMRTHAAEIMTVMRTLAGTVLVTAAVFGGQYAINVGVRAVQAMVAAATQSGALAAMMGVEATAAATASTATRALAISMVVLRGAIIATGIGVLVVGAGYLLGKFFELVGAAGGFGKALTLLGDVASGVWAGIVESAKVIPLGLAARWEAIKASFFDLMATMLIKWKGFVETLSGAFDGTQFQGASDSLKSSADGLASSIADYNKAASDADVASEQLAKTASEKVTTAFAGARDAFGKLSQTASETNTTTTDFGGGGGGLAAVSKGADKAKQKLSDLQQVMKRLRDQNAELSATMNMTDLQAQIWKNQNEAGVSADSANGKEIARLTTLNEGMQTLKSATDDWQSSLSSTFGELLSGTLSFNKALGQVIGKLGEMWMNSAFQSLFAGSSGWMGSVLSGLGIGQNANGTNNWAGGWTSINERGGEIVNLPSGTQIIPHDVSNRLADSAGGSGGALDVRITAAFDESGNLYVKQVAQAASASAVSSYDAALPNRVQQISANPRRR
ncbi:hypothetical protein [Paenirhodobacter enshiensis]|uniref:hypothetical protein n=1 Tax=Paenirhodobacter enshiensis TaxID=1105367 RepID=UPI000690028F|nr:hypothetical protein [Paenirhodobacter enshiensis]